MPFNRPTPNTIKQRLEVELNAAFPGAEAKLRHSVEAVITRMLAMASHEMFGFIDWLSKQILPDTAEAEWIDRHGTLKNVTRKDSTPATGEIQFTGTNGITIPAGSVLRRADDVEFTLDADVTIDAGVGSGDVTCTVPGAAGNGAASIKLTLTSPIAGVQSQATVTGPGLTGGFDQEGDDDLRDRVIERWREPPQGGAAHDYNAWAKEVPGVTRAWSYPMQYGLGTVGIVFVMDNKVGTIIPSAGEVEDVQEYIDTVRPVTAEVTVIAPTAVPVNLEIHISPNTEAIRNAIMAEVHDFFKREAIPGGTMYLSRLSEAISTASGEFRHVLVTPNANIVRTYGQLSVVGTFTWDSL